MQNASEGRKWQQFIPWLWFALALVWFFAFAFWDHAQGRSWASAFGFPMDLRFVAGFVGGFVIPFVLTMAMLRYANRLSPSREKAILTRIGWSLYAYLLFWSVISTLFLHRY